MTTCSKTVFRAALLASSLFVLSSGAFLSSATSFLTPTLPSLLRTIQTPSPIPIHGITRRRMSFYHHPSRSNLQSQSGGDEEDGSDGPARRFGPVRAVRASLRASTGFSLTAAKLALRGVTSKAVTGSMKRCTAIFPSSIRYFIQPFFILYFTPIMILRGLFENYDVSNNTINGTASVVISDGS